MGAAASVGDDSVDVELLVRLVAECGALPTSIDREELVDELRPTYVLALREGNAEEAFTALKGEYRRAVRAAAAATAGASAGRCRRR